MTAHKLYGLIGRPLGHSFSRDFFTEMFREQGIDAEYRNFELPDVGDVMELIAEYPELRGFNVTIPYKEAVIPYIDRLNETAAGVGAVNVVKIDVDGGEPVLSGFNTDVIGFRESIRPLLNDERRSALVLGTGGASKAVQFALSQLGVGVLVVSRTPSDGEIGYDGIDADVMNKHKIIVNTTPLGMYPKVDVCPDIPYDMLSPGYLCYDVVYNPTETLFMRRAAEHGAEVKNGLEMLKLQALAAWSIWSDKSE